MTDHLTERHATACCIIHGCHYGVPDCPVETAAVRQKGACSQCLDEAVQEARAAFIALHTLQKPARLGGKKEADRLELLDKLLDEVMQCEILLRSESFSTKREGDGYLLLKVPGPLWCKLMDSDA